MIDEQMKKYFLYITISLCGLLVTACQQETLVDSAKGGFAITLLDETAATDVMTKASPLKLPASVSKEFHLTITKNSNGYVLYDGGYTEEVIPAAAATYTVKATFGEENILEVNNPYFVGEEDNVEVKAGDEPTTVELACKLANALTSVRFGEGDENRAKFDELYAPGYGVKIAIGHYSTVLTDSMKVAYYKAGTKPADVTLAFVGTIRGNGQAVEYPLDTKQFPQLAEEASYAAGAHIRLVLDMAEMATGLVPTIVYAEVVKETVTETFPMEWLPKPQVEARGDFDAKNKILFYETEQPTGSIKFNSALGLQDLRFTVAFNDPTYSSLNGDYTLSTMTDTEKQAFATAGIILPVLGDGAENDSIGFTKEFITALTYSVDKANDKKEVSNVIQLTEVKANDKSLTSADVAEGELEFEVAVKMKPAFKISVQDYNVWSKEFTADKATITSDDSDVIYEGIVYQYSEDEKKTWIDFNDCDNTIYHYRHAFSSHPEKRTLWVRAVFRGFESKKVQIEMEEPKALPNGNMDAWTASTRDVKITAGSTKQQPIYYPWVEGSVEQWWDTNNNESMLQEVTAAYLDYKCFPTTCYESVGSGKAAVIRSVSTNAWNSEISGAGKKRGILYAGTTDYDGNRTEGQSWPSRPSKLSFWYKYDSYDNERFGAYIELYNGGTQIASGQYLSVHNVSIPSYSKMEVPLTFERLDLKATLIKIRFYSVADGEEPATRKLDVTIPAGEYEIWGGSVLYIDDISLIYDK